VAFRRITVHLRVLPLAANLPNYGAAAFSAPVKVKE
jgi:hypothetical protein